MVYVRSDAQRQGKEPTHSRDNENDAGFQNGDGETAELVRGARLLGGRTSDSQSRRPGFEYPLCYRFEVWIFSSSPGGGRIVNRSERSNGLDTARYKNVPLHEEKT